MSSSSSFSCCFNIDSIFGGLLLNTTSRCDTSQCCCSCCCSPFKPRYKRLVDNIFPSNYEDGLVKSNMEKLIFYALSTPDKLDRIGAYLAERIGRDLSRHRIGFVVIAMEAMDQLLISCHSVVNLFMESFLKVVQLVLESQDPELQILATQSFVKFATIEEDTPAYHRSYDFFVSKFSSLCHNNHNDLDTRKRLRMAGLIGIKGLILKAVSDDMQVNIWNDYNMEKIIPSLLFNMQCTDFNNGNDSPEKSHHLKDSNGNQSKKFISISDPHRSMDDNESSDQPQIVAAECLRELISRAPFGHVHKILKPIITHFDLHHFWEQAADNTKNNFAIEVFKIIMYSIQPQLSYTVIQFLMNHLDCIANDRLELKDFKFDNKIKVQTGIVNVLNEIISIPSDSIGPSVLSMINSLLQHLNDSINKIKTKYIEEEKQFQEAVINTLGEFTTNLPDYQKIETMIFIIDKAPPASCTSATEQQLQNIILKSLLKVTTKYKPVSMIQTFQSSLLNQLLSRALAPDPKTRLFVQKIFHQLLDRHKNLPRLLKPVTLTPPETLTIEKADRYDINFMRKHGHDILAHIYKNIQIESNEKENFDSIFTTMALICVEMNSEEVLIDLLRLTFALQEMALSKNFQLNDSHRCYIHSTVAGFLNLFSYLKAIPAICAHVEQVIKIRADQSKYLLPEYCDLIVQQDNGQQQHLLFDYQTTKSKENSPTKQNSLENNNYLISEELLFNKNVIAEALQTTGHDVSALNTPFQSISDVDSSITRSASDLNAIAVEIDSVNSSPGTCRKLPRQEINFTTFKEVLLTPYHDHKQESRKRLNMLQNFKNTNFDELVENYSQTNKHLTGILFQTIDKSIQNNQRNSIIEESSTMDDIDNKSINEYHQLKISTQPKSTLNSKTDDNDWHVYDNPLLSFCDLNELNSTKRTPPLFAIRFPDLFVY